MKASLQWMNEYVPIDMNKPVEELADALTQAGIPVEEIHHMDQGIKGVFTGKIIDILPHPDADKLVVCQISCLAEDGTEEIKQIVTGATNVRVGQIVPVAYHKSHLPDKTIKKGKLRGVLSEGMLCSINVLGISKDLFLPELGEGILILPPHTPIGMDIKDVLLLNDVVYEFELTANRADCFSMVGLSREFGVLTGNDITMPDITVLEEEESIETQVHISIEDPQLCSRFTARLVKNVKIQPSPLWMQNRLRNAGIRPINNVVDVTNYVMVELGQPMHAYDYDHIKGKTLVARVAKEGEVLQTLDENDRVLTSSMLVIADEERAVGVAGVMGGFDSEVTDETTNVLLEAAVFDGATTRRTSRALGLRSEASGRFERGVNPAFTPLALNRAAQLLLEVSEGAKVAKGIIDVYPNPQEERKISFTAKAINAHLGTNIEEEVMIRILQSLSFAVTTDHDVVTVTVPSWRGDVSCMQDISEEIARIYGYDNIKATMPYAALNGGGASKSHIFIRKIVNHLIQCGLNEISTFSFMHTNSLEQLLLPSDDKRYTAVPIMNPISEEYPVMRTSLLPALIETALRNKSQKNENVWLFESAVVYEPKALPINDFVFERQVISGLMVGNVASEVWPNVQRKTDFYDAKGIVESTLQHVGITNYTVQRSREPYLHPGLSADVVIDGQVLATIGELHPKVCHTTGLSDATFVFEIYMDKLLDYVTENTRYVPISKFPSTSRDLAIVAPKSVTTAEIMDIIRTEGGSYLTDAFLFDVYEGVHVPEGNVSLAYSLQYRAPDRTLTDAEIDASTDAILHALASKGCKLRQ